MRIDSTDAARLVEHTAEKPPVPVSISQKTAPVKPMDEKPTQEENKSTQISESFIRRPCLSRSYLLIGPSTAGER